MAYISMPHSVSVDRALDLGALKSIAFYIGVGLVSMAIAIPAAIATFGGA